MIYELKHFLLVLEHRTFTAAARHAHLSQPALTASIQRLEHDLGARLFFRGRRGAALTAAGRALLPHAQAVLASAEDARRAVAEIVGLHAGAVRLGAGATACTYLLPKTLAAFRERHPKVHFHLREGITHDLLEALNAGALDLAIVTGAEHGEAWYEDTLILVGAPGCRQDVDQPFVTFVRGSPTRALLEATFPDARIVMELGSIAAVKGNTRAGVGITLVSRDAVAYDLEVGRLVEIPHPATPIRRSLVLAHRGVERLAPAAAALRELLLQGAP